MDFSIQTNHDIEDRRPDLIVRTCKTIDLAVSGDGRMRRSGKRKWQNHKDLRKGLQKIWNVSVKIRPLVVGSLGAVIK